MRSLLRLLVGSVLFVAPWFPACSVTDAASSPPFHQPDGGVGAMGGAGGTDAGSGCGNGASANGATGSGATGSGATGSGASGNCSGGGAGPGGSGGVPDAGPPQCDDSLKRCKHEFDYPVGSEQTVAVRGDFAPNGWTKGVAMTKQGSNWTASVEVPYATDVQYKFVIDGTQWVTDPSNPNTISDGQGGQNSLLKGVTCSDYTCAAPPVLGYDWRDAVLYFVFVDRFKNGDPSNDGQPVSGVPQAADYQGGDWAGVKQEIDAGYFTDLGVNTLWLTVPMDNPEKSGVGTDGKQYSAYHGYWPLNLDKPEERFGTMAELKGLVDDAHQHKLKVILDYAMNHVYIDSPVYQQHHGWFWPVMNGNTKCVCGQGCAWDGPDAKRCWFADYLPDFNFTVQAARDFSTDNAISWIKNTGADGFRLDAVKHIEDSWVTELRSKVTSQIEPTSKQHFYMVGETFTGDRNAIRYYVQPNMLDGQFDFPLRAEMLKTLLIRSAPLSELDSFLATNDNFYGSGIMSTFIGNHDVPRAIEFALDTPMWGNEWADGKDRAWQNQPTTPTSASPYERLATAYTVLFTLRGIPLIYYGDEIGLPGAGDPDNRRMMQWSGYTQNQIMLRDHISTLAKIRAAHPALRDGQRSTLSVGTDTYAYSMSSGTDTVYVLINRGDSAQNVGGLPAGNYTNLLDSSAVSGPAPNLPARSSMVLVKK